MLYRVAELEVDRRNGQLSFFVDFWAEKSGYDFQQPPTVTEHFLFDVPPAVDAVDRDLIGRPFDVGQGRYASRFEEDGQGGWQERTVPTRTVPKTYPLVLRAHRVIVRWWNRYTEGRVRGTLDPDVDRSTDPTDDSRDWRSHPEYEALEYRVWTDE